MNTTLITVQSFLNQRSHENGNDSFPRKMHTRTDSRIKPISQFTTRSHYIYDLIKLKYEATLSQKHLRLEIMSFHQ
jgi:hypothetical protein